MFKNHVRVALRSLRRNPGLSAINILGLSAGMAVGLLILLFLWQQSSLDAFHENSERIFRVNTDFKSQVNADNAMYATSPANLASLTLVQVPGIAEVVRISNSFSGTATPAGEAFALSGIYADPSLLKVFDFDLAFGNEDTALDMPGSVLLSSSLAIRLFGTEDAVGQTLPLGLSAGLEVTGVFGAESYSTHVPLETVVSWATCFVTTFSGWAQWLACTEATVFLVTIYKK